MGTKTILTKHDMKYTAQFNLTPFVIKAETAGNDADDCRRNSFSWDYNHDRFSCKTGWERERKADNSNENTLATLKYTLNDKQSLGVAYSKITFQDGMFKDDLAVSDATWGYKKNRETMELSHTWKIAKQYSLETEYEWIEFLTSSGTDGAKTKERTITLTLNYAL